MRQIRFWLRARRKKQRLFACPVCHLELSLNDLDKEGYTVCPVCGVVLEVVMSAGFPLPVVHDVEIKRAQPRYRTHSMSTHLSIGLLPVSLLFNIAALMMALAAPMASYSVQLETLGLGLFALSFIGSFATFGLGYWDWKTRYRARPYHFITSKIRMSWLLWAVAAVALAVRFSMGCCPASADALMSPAFVLYLVLQASALGVIGVIGHIGGNLVFGK